MPKKRCFVAYRCDRENEFWDDVEARGFEIDFVDSENELAQVLRALNCPVVVTTDSNAWSSAVRVTSRLTAGARVLLLPLESRSVSVVDPENSERIPGPFTRYQLADALEKACAVVATPNQGEPTDGMENLRERLVARVREADGNAAPDEAWFELVREDLRAFPEAVD
ncbi:MAG: hypothetical protein GXO73_10280 [Calditrichaeota bacterium]|nr:hypothetical protein [Calditrichota bacterium]